MPAVEAAARSRPWRLFRSGEGSRKSQDTFSTTLVMMVTVLAVESINLDALPLSGTPLSHQHDHRCKRVYLCMQVRDCHASPFAAPSMGLSVRLHAGAGPSHAGVTVRLAGP